MLITLACLYIGLYDRVLRMRVWRHVLPALQSLVETPANQTKSQPSTVKKSLPVLSSKDTSYSAMEMPDGTIPREQLNMDGTTDSTPIQVDDILRKLALTADRANHWHLARSNGQYESNENLAGRDLLTELEDGCPTNHSSSSESGSFIAGEFCPDSTFGESMCDDVCSDELDCSGSFSSEENVPSGKPLDVLVYCGKKDSARKFDGIKRVLDHCINTLRYTIYHLKHEEVKNAAWFGGTALVVIACENLYDDVDVAFLDFFKRGGRVLSFGSSLDSRVVKRQTRLSSPLNLVRVATVAEGDARISAIGGRYSYDLSEVVDSKVTVECLAKETTSDIPMILKVVSNDAVNAGQMILSQVFLEKDPSELAVVSDVFRELKASNEARFRVLRNLFMNLGLNCERENALPYTPAYIFSKTPQLKTSLLDAIRPRLKDGLLRSESKSLFFPASEEEIPQATGKITPVVSDAKESSSTHFSPARYFGDLTARRLGNVVIYTEVLETTMNMLDSLKFSMPSGLGLVAIATRQTAGKGRGGNAWLSPLGCAMCSLHVRFPVQSKLGQRSPFVQHLASLAAVLAVRTIPGYEDLDVRLKWPNDVYFGDSLKLGGVLVNSTIMGSDFHVIIGIGVNVANSNPTICINDAISQHNRERGCDLSAISVERFIARTISQVETLIDDFQQNGRHYVCDLYYKYWLHSDVVVTLVSEGGEEVTIRGLDDFGYLDVETKGGERLSVHPDGNSFDMMKNLIAEKARP